MKYRRPLLVFVLGAIAVTAVLGLYAVLVPDFGQLQAKVLGTSAAISAASILILACTPAWERRLVLPLPVVGAGLVAATWVLVVLGMWAEVERAGYWKTMGTTVMLAIWAVLVCLLALAALPRRYRWTFFAAAGFTLALALAGIGVMWSEPDSSGVGRLVGALAVLSAAFVLAVPVLHRASRAELIAEEAPAGSFCPRCGAAVAAVADAGPATCSRCSARFQVTYVEQ